MVHTHFRFCYRPFPLSFPPLQPPPSPPSLGSPWSPSLSLTFPLPPAGRELSEGQEGHFSPQRPHSLAGWGSVNV